MSAEDRARLRKQMAEQAVRLAVSSRWEEAAAVNTEFLRLFGDDVDAYNRLGKALSELGRMADARGAYTRALQIEPANTIAKRNLDRLSAIGDEAPGDAGQVASQLDTSLFIEETGKAAVAVLQAVDRAAATQLDAGDLVELHVEGKAVNVQSKSGRYIGMVEPRIGLRLARMIEGGNRYSAAAVSVSGTDIRVILRETFQHPTQIGRVSFPQGRISEVRGYTRRSLLREEVEYFDDDEEVEPESEEGWSTTDEDSDSSADVGIEPEDESFD